MRCAIYHLNQAPSFKNQAHLLRKTAIKLGFQVDFRNLWQPPDLKTDRWDRSIFLAPLWPRYMFDAVRLSGPWLSRHFTFYGPVDGPFTQNITFFKVMAQMEVVTTSAWCQTQISKAGINIKGFVHHGIDLQDFRFSEKQIQDRRDRILKNHPGAKIFFSNCNPLHRKGFHFLAQALIKLYQQRKEGWVMVLHTGRAEALKLAPKLKGLKNLIIEDHYNQVPFKQIALKTVACDCFVWPSLLEGFGLPLLEAHAGGRPSICVNAGPMNEIATDRTAYMIPFTHIKKEKWKGPGCEAQLHQYDPLEITEAMIKVLDYPEEAEEKGREAKKRAKKFCYMKAYGEFVKGRV